jgi:hypothetical protein
MKVGLLCHAPSHTFAEEITVNRFSDALQAVYGVLKEAEHRSTFYIPYWNIPIARYIVPRQRKFHADLEVINDCLDSLIARAKQTRQADDVEALQTRDYSKARVFPVFCSLLLPHSTAFSALSKLVAQALSMISAAVH